MFSSGTTKTPWRRTERDPEAQPLFAYVDDAWKPAESETESESESEKPPPDSFATIAWNIDFMRILDEQRMKAALKYVHGLVEGSGGKPTVVMFNEMVDTDLQQIQDQPWIQQGYNITDLTPEYWESDRYGTCILVPKSMPVTSVFRVHYKETAFQRDALFVDIDLPGKRTLRIGTTHLESLEAKPPIRPFQMARAASFMHKAYASVLGGDMNAHQPFDKTLHLENKLKDTYLETGGEEGAESGMTWGQMGGRRPRARFGLSRLDKLLFCGGIEAKRFETFGIDVEVEDEADRKEIMEEDGLEKGWVTDHLGVRGEFRVIVPE